MVVGVDVRDYYDNVDIVEAEALCFGLRFVIELDLSPLIVNLDLLRITQFI